MEIKEKILTAVIVISVLILIAVIGVSLGIFKTEKIKEIKVATDKQEYQAGETLKVQIDNNSGDTLCFSSCYPYYIEKESGGQWNAYSYNDCSSNDIVDKCLDSKNTKAFELVLPFLEKGEYRLAVPTCLACAPDQIFKQEKWFYSNEFIIE